MPVARTTQRRLPPLPSSAPAAPEKLEQPNKGVAVSSAPKQTVDDPQNAPPPVFQRLVQPAAVGRFSRAANALRRAAKQLVLAERFESLNPDVKKSKKRSLAPFSLVTRYQRVRSLLDPVRDRHLLGSDMLVASSSGANKDGARRIDGNRHEGSPADDNDDDGSLHGRSSPSSVAAAKASSSAVLTAFEPESEVPLESVMIPLGEHGGTGRSHRRSTVGSSGIQWASSVGDDSAAERAALPDGREIALLPTELALTFFTVATDRFRKLLYPRLLLAVKKRRQRALEHDMLPRASRPSTDFFKRFKLFAQWTPEALSLAVESLVYRCIDANRFIWYTGEPGGTLGIVLLSHGTCRSLRNSRRSAGEKRLTADTTVVIGTHHSGHMFNEYSFVTEEPQMRFVKTQTRCDLWSFSGEAFRACVALLPESTRSAMAQLAFVRRQKMIPEAYAFTPSLLRRQCATFSRNQDTVLTAIIQAMKPVAMHGGDVIAEEGEMPGSMFFLRRGKVGTYQMVNGELTHVRSIYAPATLMESSVLHRQENTELIKTISECDFLTISLDDINHIMSQHPSEREVLQEVSREEKMKILSKQQLRFRPLLFKVPIIRHLLEAEHISTLSHLFEGKVYTAMEIIASKADMCDRVIILTKGEVSMGEKGAIWNLGEAIGFTCLTPHRWTKGIVALTQCECIELRRDFLAAFLQDCDVFDDAVEICELLLCPGRFQKLDDERRLVERGVSLTPALKALHRAGQLFNTHQRASSSTSSPPLSTPPTELNGLRLYGTQSPTDAPAQRRRERLCGIVNSVRHDLAVMLTPPTFPVASPARLSVAEASSEPGFVSSKISFRTTELAVPGGLYVPCMTEAEREEALASALFNHKRDPVRRVAKITPFLMVKQRS